MMTLHELDDKKSDDQSVEFKASIRSLLELRATALNNLAAAQLKTEAYDQALKSVNSSLQINPDNVKAQYRKAKILAAKGEVASALDTMRTALKLEPESRTILAEVNKLIQMRKDELQKEKAMYKKMFDVPQEKRKQTSQKSGSSSSILKKLGILGATVGVALVSAAAYHYFNQY